MGGQASQLAVPPPARPLRAAACLSALVALAYASSFQGAFQFDDLPAIVENPTLRHLGTSLRPPVGALTVSGRPLLNFTFGLNYALSADRVWSYHLFNLAIHLGATLLLWGIVRRTLAARGQPWANGAAFATALLWGVHPLTTEAVTYLVQRAESLMALGYLGALYGFIRMVRPEAGDAAGRRGFFWGAVSWAACLVGVLCKEVAVSAPVVILLYDRAFVAASWREILRTRARYYGALCSTWLILLLLVGANGWDRGGTSGLGVGIAWLPYWMSQGEAVFRYVGLSLWPHPLAFDYGLPSVPFGPAIVLTTITLAVAGAAFVGSWRGRAWAFVVSSAFLILSPTSVMPGVLQFASEHRMYLPLAFVVAGLVGGGARLLERWADGAQRRRAGFVLVSVAAVALGALTFARNRTYASDLGLWQDTVAQRPTSATAQANLGQALFVRGRIAEGLPHCELAVRLNPALPTARYNLGLAYEAQERWTEALAQFGAACAINPKLFYAQYRAGRILDRLNRPAEAKTYLLAALRQAPDMGECHASLGVAEQALGHYDEAAREYAKALAFDPKQPDVEYNLGQLLERLGLTREALVHYRAAVKLKPEYWEAQLNAGIALAQLGQFEEGEADLRAAVRLRPASAEAHANLGIVLDQTGRGGEAIAEYRRALELRPDYADAHYNLGNALVAARDLAGARREFVEAVRLQPNFAAAREMIGRIDAFRRSP